MIHDERRARNLSYAITGDWNDSVIKYLIAYADEIRLECAENARNAIFDFGIGDKEHIYSPIIRKDLAAQLVERAIMRKEAGE